MVRVIGWSVSTVAAALVVIAPALSAQSTSGPPEATAIGESASPDSAPAPKKKKGLFGKLKDVAGNKVVKTVAKSALCTMVPGGQMMAGALDAATSENAGDAVAGAAGAASGNNCRPGMAGLAGGMPAGGAAAAAGMSSGMGAALSGGLPTGIVPGLGGGGAAAAATAAAATAAAGAVMTGMAGMHAMPAGLGSGGSGDEEGLTVVAGCMGLTTEEYLDFVSPTHGENRSPTKDEMKRQAKLAKKVDTQRYQACMMQQMSAPSAPRDE